MKTVHSSIEDYSAESWERVCRSDNRLMSDAAYDAEVVWEEMTGDLYDVEDS